MEKKRKYCQSCGMPMKRDMDGGGTNTDGTRSKMYCSYCFQEGQFTRPDITAQQMQVFCKDKLEEMGIPGILAKWFTRGVPDLDRWKKI